MSTKIGRFEILGELAKSDTGCVYKANDPESGQTLALKTYRLEVFGEHAEEVVQRILQEAETTKDLSSPNITLVYGAGEIDGQFCAAMEYIQGNSIATMLARKEGFSIWDLLDISRQVCQGLDHAHEHSVFHFSLEPSKVMVTWDGTVKILSFGISSTGYVAAGASGVPPSVLFYMSPEQVRGETLDARSNLFTWAAILYEMVTDQKAFPGSDADEVRQRILQEMPAAPAILNPKINPVASDVIMKALAKDPADRYQSGRELLNDLEKARESVTKVAKKASEAPKATTAPAATKAAAAAKFASSIKEPGPSAPRPQPKPVDTRIAPPVASTAAEPAEAAKAAPAASETPEPAPKATAAAAGWNSAASSARTPHLDPSAQFISTVVKASVGTLEGPSATMSAGVADEPVTETPRIAVDPMMAENAGPASKSVSFSEMEELPPLKEVFIAPPAPKAEEAVPEEEPLPSIILRKSEPEKPKIQPREVAEKAIKEIKTVPPQLLMYSLAAAVAVILIVGIAVFWRSHSQGTDEEGRVPVPAASKPEPAAEQPAPEAQAPSQPEPTAEAAVPAEPVVEEPVATRATGKARGKNKKNAAPAPAAAIPGQLAIDSSPEGAQLEIDGRTDANWVTPYTLAGMPPGQHTVTVSKSGFASETRTVDVVSASKAFLVVHLASLNASMNVTSEPAGASIFVDGKDTMRVTPAVITLEKGTHTVLVRKAGYLDETTSAAGQPGQSYHFSSTLRPLGNVDEIKTVGKFKKLFGGNGAQGMGKVSVKTSPKGAQIAINRRLLEKNSPVEFLLNPGNYIVDITLTGYKPVQKVITVEQGGSVAIDEALQMQ